MMTGLLSYLTGACLRARSDQAPGPLAQGLMGYLRPWALFRGRNPTWGTIPSGLSAGSWRSPGG